MKKLFLAGIAALSVLSASAAEARPWAAYHCGKHQIAGLPPKYFWPTREKCSGAPCDGKPHYFAMRKDLAIYGPPVDRWIREKGDDLFYKGKKCREFTDEEYN